jgi:hypothetical protein
LQPSGAVATTAARPTRAGVLAESPRLRVSPELADPLCAF